MLEANNYMDAKFQTVTSGFDFKKKPVKKRRNSDSFLDEDV